MLDLSNCPVVDNHCHPMDPQKAILEPQSLAREFYHGIGDVPKTGAGPRSWDLTDELQAHFPNLGVVQTMVRQLSELFDCSLDLTVVAEERNRRTSESFGEYAQLLYRDAGIVTTVVDSGLPDDDPAWQLFPGTVLKMFQMEPALNRFLKECGTYRELLNEYQILLDHKVRESGLVGVKSHLAELVGFGVDATSDEEAETVFPSAKTGDSAAYKKLYVAVFTETLRQCQELGIPVHLHSGFTGGIWDGHVHNADPFLLIPLLRQPEFLQTRVVLLHGGYPWIQNAAAVAHALPHVWVDMGWTSPWISLRITECYRDLVGMAPLSKLMIGSGGHGTPEIAWLAAKTSKIALREVLSDAERFGLLTAEQSETIGQGILYDNAARMYGLPSAEELRG